MANGQRQQQRRNGRNRNRRRYFPSAKTQVVNANRVTSRIVNRISNVSLNAAGPNGGTRGYATVLNPLSAFAGSESLAAQYDQFRIRHISIYARPDTANSSNFTAGQFNALYTAVNTTTVSSYVDYDTFAAPTESTFLGRDSMKIRSLPGGKFTLVANYSPRVRMSDAVNNLPALVPPTTSWISTEFADLDWLGLALRLTCDGGAWGVDANNCLRVQLFIKATVDFRGMTKPNDTLAVPQVNDPSIIQGETIHPSVPAPTYDLSVTMDELRIRLLTGVYVPLVDLGISFGNIGHTVTADQTVGMKFRHETTNYEIVLGDDTTAHATAYV